MRDVFIFRVCLDFWKTSRGEFNNCTRSNLRMSDIVKPCRLFAQEMWFQKRLGEKVKKNLRYIGKSFEEMLWAAKMPLTVYWKVCNIFNVSTLFE